ncbi:DUF4397 domain-containing protein [Halorussus salinisoli]|uniref:DUF4397 domain-containing protein n=1 Tax=Halorussus salinisoli TaxID=2558242 RepID=UPI001484CD4D|nr:DUF4397 domain-containing protein [Halorussus salinisoli]
MTPDEKPLKRLVAVGLAITLIASLGVGGSFAAVQDEEAQVRVAHVSPDAPAVDVLVDGDPVLEGVEFGTVSDYLNVSAGEHNVTIQTSEDESVVFEGNVTLDAGTQTTIAALGEVGEETFEPGVFEDDFETPGEGNASVRLIHASPDAPAVDVTVAGTDTVLFDNVSFANASDYVEVPADDYELEVRTATEDNDGEVVSTVNVSLESGTANTAFAAGYLSPEEAAGDEPFQLILVTDSEGEAVEETTPMETTPAEMNETTTEA